MDYREARAALRYYGIEASEGEAASIVRTYDDNPDGKLDRVEFAQLVRDLEGGTLRREGRVSTASGTPYGGSRRYYDGTPSRYGASSPGRSHRDGPRDSWSDRDSAYRHRHGSDGLDCCGEWRERTWGDSLARAGAYIMDVAFRAVVFAGTASYVIAPDRLIADADVAARAVVGQNAAEVVAQVPSIMYIVVLGMLALLVLAWLGASCGLRRFLCLPFWRNCRGCSCRGCLSCLPCCRSSYDYRGYGDYDEEYRSGGGYRGFERKTPLGRMSRDGRETMF